MMEKLEILKGEKAKGLMQLGLRVNIIRKDGTVKKGEWQRSRSFVLQFLQILETAFERANKTGVLDTTNTSRTVTHPDGASTGWMDVEAASAVSDFGIQVGSDNTAPTASDYALNTQIAHGNGGGQLMYGAVTIGVTRVVGSNVELMVHRMFENQSGGAVSVEEIALVSQNINSLEFLLARDLLSFSISNGDSAIVEYKLITAA